MKAIAVLKTIGLSLCLVSVMSVATAASEDPSAARSVVDRYFQALTQGDTEAFQALLGGRMLTRMSRNMINPNYGTFLQERYASTRHRVEETRVSEAEDGGVEVTVEVIHPSAGTDTYTYVLRRESEEDSYKILSEF